MKAFYNKKIGDSERLKLEFHEIYLVGDKRLILSSGIRIRALSDGTGIVIMADGMENLSIQPRDGGSVTIKLIDR